jgi:hypothetical protein
LRHALSPSHFDRLTCNYKGRRMGPRDKNVQLICAKLQHG